MEIRARKTFVVPGGEPVIYTDISYRRGKKFTRAS